MKNNNYLEPRSPLTSDITYYVSPNHKVIRYVDLYFPTLVADGEVVIDRGHLTALDDAAVRRIASKYGDPDILLKEDWIPAVSGVNSP